jgi:predicted RNase H-like HicB family nuclease
VGFGIEHFIPHSCLIFLCPYFSPRAGTRAFEQGGVTLLCGEIYVIVFDMLTSYIENLIKKAKYEILNDGTYYGEIPSVQGVWANEDSLWLCEQTLRQALEEWLVIKLRLNDKLPIVGKVNLNAVNKMCITAS